MGTNLNQCEFPVKLLERKVRSKPHILHVNKALLLLLMITIPKPKGRSFDPFNGQLHCRVLSIFFSLESVTNCTPAAKWGLTRSTIYCTKKNPLLLSLFLEKKVHFKESEPVCVYSNKNVLQTKSANIKPLQV